MSEISDSVKWNAAMSKLDEYEERYGQLVDTISGVAVWDYAENPESALR